MFYRQAAETIVKGLLFEIAYLDANLTLYLLAADAKTNTVESWAFEK